MATLYPHDAPISSLGCDVRHVGAAHPFFVPTSASHDHALLSLYTLSQGQVRPSIQPAKHCVMGHLQSALSAG